MIVRKCDRCGSFYIPKNDPIIYAVSKHISLVDMQLNLCPDCHNDLNMVHLYLKQKKVIGSSTM